MNLFMFMIRTWDSLSIRPIGTSFHAVPFNLLASFCLFQVRRERWRCWKTAAENSRSLSPHAKASFRVSSISIFRCRAKRRRPSILSARWWISRGNVLFMMGIPNYYGPIKQIVWSLRVRIPPHLVIARRRWWREGGGNVVPLRVGHVLHNDF